MDFIAATLARTWCGVLALVTSLSGCGGPLAEPQEKIVTIEAQETPAELYVLCSESLAATVLSLKVTVPNSEEHHERFPLRLDRVLPSRYPAHRGGITSADGISPSGEGVGFNRSCYIDSAVGNAVCVRFRLSYKEGMGVKGTVDELMWITVDRDTTIHLPNHVVATATFSKPHPSPAISGKTTP